uniref:Uncharacterized protein n=1 Tax=Romanomermis culicivorax TaxID=13658 RepID=A0A915KL38_ROMCU
MPEPLLAAAPIIIGGIGGGGGSEPFTSLLDEPKKTTGTDLQFSNSILEHKNSKIVPASRAEFFFYSVSPLKRFLATALAYAIA